MWICRVGVISHQSAEAPKRGNRSPGIWLHRSILINHRDSIDLSRVGWVRDWCLEGEINLGMRTECPLTILQWLREGIGRRVHIEGVDAPNLTIERITPLVDVISWSVIIWCGLIEARGDAFGDSKFLWKEAFVLKEFVYIHGVKRLFVDRIATTLGLSAEQRTTKCELKVMSLCVGAVCVWGDTSYLTEFDGGRLQEVSCIYEASILQLGIVDMLHEGTADPLDTPACFDTLPHDIPVRLPEYDPDKVELSQEFLVGNGLVRVGAL